MYKTRKNYSSAKRLFDEASRGHTTLPSKSDMHEDSEFIDETAIVMSKRCEYLIAHHHLLEKFNWCGIWSERFYQKIEEAIEAATLDVPVVTAARRRSSVKLNRTRAGSLISSPHL